MSKNPQLNQITMDILVEAVSDLLGSEDKVTEKVQIAAALGDVAEYRAAERVFNKLPREQRANIRDRATLKAKRSGRYRKLTPVTFVQKSRPNSDVDWLDK